MRYHVEIAGSVAVASDLEHVVHILTDYGVVGPLVPVWPYGAGDTVGFLDADAYNRADKAIRIWAVSGAAAPVLDPIDADEVARINHHLRRLGCYAE